jgi:hypothetical protein
VHEQDDDSLMVVGELAEAVVDEAQVELGALLTSSCCVGAARCCRPGKQAALLWLPTTCTAAKPTLTQLEEASSTDPDACDQALTLFCPRVLSGQGEKTSRTFLSRSRGCCHCVRIHLPRSGCRLR